MARVRPPSLLRARPWSRRARPRRSFVLRTRALGWCARAVRLRRDPLGGGGRDPRERGLPRMNIDVVTLFPAWFDWFMEQRHVRNALSLGHSLETVDLRGTTPLKAGQVDDTPYGGGAGMVVRVDVVEAALEARYGSAPPGHRALGHEESALEESFSEALEGAPEYPHYTRPFEWRGHSVPEVLLSGDHARIREWRLARSRERAL